MNPLWFILGYIIFVGVFLGAILIMGKRDSEKRLTVFSIGDELQIFFPCGEILEFEVDAYREKYITIEGFKGVFFVVSTMNGGYGGGGSMTIRRENPPKGNKNPIAHINKMFSY